MYSIYVMIEGQGPIWEFHWSSVHHRKLVRNVLFSFSHEHPSTLGPDLGQPRLAPQGGARRRGWTSLPARRRSGSGRSSSKPRNPRNFDTIGGGGTGVSDTFIDKTVFHVVREAQPLFHALFCVNTLSGTLFSPASTAKGLRA